METIKLWLARDMDGDLYLFNHKPRRNFAVWVDFDFGAMVMLDKKAFPQVKWNDEEPTEVELKIVKWE